eukprot:4315591-Amphidinium_carterae.2
MGPCKAHAYVSQGLDVSLRSSSATSSALQAWMCLHALVGVCHQSWMSVVQTCPLPAFSDCCRSKFRSDGRQACMS